MARQRSYRRSGLGKGGDCGKPEQRLPAVHGPAKRFFPRAVTLMAVTPLVFPALGRGTSRTTEGRMNERKEYGPHVTRSAFIRRSQTSES